MNIFFDTDIKYTSGPIFLSLKIAFLVLVCVDKHATNNNSCHTYYVLQFFVASNHQECNVARTAITPTNLTTTSPVIAPPQEGLGDEVAV